MNNVLTKQELIKPVENLINI